MVDERLFILRVNQKFPELKTNISQYSINTKKKKKIEFVTFCMSFEFYFF